MLYHSTTLFILEKIKEYYLDAVNQKNLEYTSFKELSMPPPKNKSFPLLKDGESEDYYLKHFMQQFRQKSEAVFTIKIPTCVVEISKNIFKDNVNSTDEKFVFKVMKKQRHLYLNYIADGIKFPQEIWKYKYKGRERLNLLSRYKSKNGNIEIIAVFENKKSVFVGISAYQAIYDDYFERQRVGNRIYVKI